MNNITLLTISEMYSEMSQEDPNCFPTLSLSSAQSAVTVELEKKFGCISEEDREKIDEVVSEMH